MGWRSPNWGALHCTKLPKVFREDNAVVKRSAPLKATGMATLLGQASDLAHESEPCRTKLTPLDFLCTELQLNEN